MRSEDIILFAGPSLPEPCEAERRLPIHRHGPAAQGDVLRAALLQPRAIVLIDGFFETFPAVYHKEILWALGEGIAVYGAASTGALRASELQRYGMVGVGEIFRGFADGSLIRDDEVALIHAPQEVGYAYLSEPLINIRHTLNAAVSDRVLNADIAAELVDLAERTFYPDRSYKLLLSECAKIDPAAAEQLGIWLGTGQIDQKNADARACLERVAADFEANTMTAAADFEFRHTDAFETLLQEVLSESPAADPLALERLRAASAERYERLRASAEIAELALTVERQSGLAISPADLAREVSDFRLRHALHDQTALTQWLDSHALDIDTLSRKLEERARISRARRGVEPRLDTRMRDLLRLADNASGQVLPGSALNDPEA